MKKLISIKRLYKLAKTGNENRLTYSVPAQIRLLLITLMMPAGRAQRWSVGGKWALSQYTWF